MDDKERRAKHAKPAVGDSADVGAPAPSGPGDVAGSAPGSGAGDPSASPASPDGSASPAAVLPAEGEGAAKRRRSRIIAGVVAVCLLVAYLCGGAYFSGHFLPKTEIGSYDISGLSVDEAVNLLDESAGDYTLEVSGEGLDFTITTAETGLRIDSAAVVEKAIAQNAAWEWPYRIATAAPQDLTDAMQATYDEAGFTDLVKRKVAEVNEAGTDPVSAGISYDKAQGSFKVYPEVLGTKLDEGAVVEKVERAAFRMEDSVVIGEDELLRPPLVSDDPRLADAATAADGLLGAQVDVQLAGLSLATIDDELVASWISLDENIVPFVDEGILRGWTGGLAEKTNTIGKKREFDTPRGDHVTVEGGSYGWEIDYDPFVQAVIEAVAAREKGVLEVPCSSTAASLPDEHNVDFGKRYIEVNLTTQHAVFYDGSEVLWESDIVSGAPDEKHRTPTGVYYVIMKESPSKLVGENVPTTVEYKDDKGKTQTRTEMKPEYETVVTYWMPFVGNSVGFHDATWQPGFGGSLYTAGYGSHGCVNLPFSAAEELYGIVTAGTPVITHE